MASSYMDISFYGSMYLQDEYQTFIRHTFCFLVSVTVISYLLLRDVLSGLQVAEELLFLSARRRAYIITTFHSLLINFLLSQPP